MIVSSSGMSAVAQPKPAAPAAVLSTAVFTPASAPAPPAPPAVTASGQAVSTTTGNTLAFPVQSFSPANPAPGVLLPPAPPAPPQSFSPASPAPGVLLPPAPPAPPQSFSPANPAPGVLLPPAPPGLPVLPIVTSPSGAPVSSQTGAAVSLVNMSNIAPGVFVCSMSDGTAHYCDQNANPISYVPPLAPAVTASGTPISTATGTAAAVPSTAATALTGIEAWLTGTMIGSIPNWMLLAGAGLLLMGGDSAPSHRGRK